MIIGNRGGSETFPYGYFKAWTLNTNTGDSTVSETGIMFSEAWRWSIR